jgi:transposase
MPQKLNAAIAVIGIDIGKNSFHLVGHDHRGAIVLRQKWSRGQVETRLANLPPCLIGMEACVGAHHLSRKLQMLGHDARLMPAKYVRPYSKGQKNDFRDAEAIAEAVQRATMKFVATKTADQLDLQALHRVRERLVGQRTGVINQIRAFLLERGIAVRQGLRSLRSELPGILATRTDVLAPRMLRIIEDLAGDWRRLDARIEDLSSEIEALARHDKGCERLMTVPGIGPIISSAMVAAIGTGDSTDLLDPIARLLRLLDRPDDVAVLGPMLEREILWRLLTGEQGGTVRQIGLADSRLSQVSRAIRWIRAHYAETLRIEDLAQVAGMSASSFHRHFRAVTAMSPLQYQKQIRLQEARTRLWRNPRTSLPLGSLLVTTAPRS